MSVEGLGNHRYDARLPLDERNGLVYTCRGGLIDVGHLRATIDRTAYLASRDGPVSIDVVGGRATFTARPTPPEDRAALAARAAFELAVWREEATLKGIGRRRYFSEDFSAFSPEDLYSDLLGAHVALRALNSPLPFEAAADEAIATTLRALGAVDLAETRSALDKLSKRWWRKGVSVPFAELLRERRLDRRPPLSPLALLDDDALEVGCADPSLVALDVPGTLTSSRSTFELDFDVEAPTPEPAQVANTWPPVLRLQSIRLLPVELYAGGFGTDDAKPTFGFRVRGGEARTWGGDLRIIRFGTTYDADERGVAFNLVGIEASSLFFCRERSTGEWYPPIASWFAACAPGGIGLGGRLLQMQYEGRTGRTVLRPIEMTLDYDLGQTAFTPAFLHRNIVLSGGLGVDSALIPNEEDHVAVRALAAVRFTLGDENGRWSLRGRSAFRPSLLELADWSVESSAELIHRVFVGSDGRSPSSAVLLLGLQVGHTHWRFPERSIADEIMPVVSADRRNTIFGLLSVGARFEALTF